jgi:hypothetical protein
MAFYVYVYRDPLNGNVPIYVGKGKGARAWEHQRPDSRFGYIHKRCLDAGQRFVPEIVAEFENENDAYRLEAELIFKYGQTELGTGTLMNRIAGRWMKKQEWHQPWVKGVRKKRRRRGRGKKNREAIDVLRL